jgi:amiloride-sensitive sodium channel
VIQLLAMWGVTFIILDVWREYINSPTVTTVDSTTYPIWNVPFPAIAVCNINKISKSAAWTLAQNLYVTEKKNLNNYAQYFRLNLLKPSGNFTHPQV